ncbi:polyprenyl diphosphate synthase [Mailhella massiliensis]|uniref:Isoprenyl transferase n=1 Tax=Mailhella massiliensis TaxID=1903261 RepID=A0A921AY45_9BACT|nr:polyprenyl diphosphate synthase [Mailhella massiliensis]HJD98186.1 di-trans,poly-cis-decaprenylcistransferase [Mailhella massiliensis]
MEEKLPEHIAVIMDGNGRWARERGLPRSRGHLAGVDAVRTLVRECRRLGIGHVTVYAFSRENWQRPETEVSFLFDLFLKFLRQELPELMKEDIRLSFIGERADLPFAVRRAMDYAVKKTAANRSMVFTLAISYAGREEILRAARLALEKGLKPEELTEEAFRSLLYDPALPDPDLVIRTSGEERLSNFLLFQSAYAELYFSPVLWPDFGPEELAKALRSYAGRVRRFGRTDEQLG